MGLEVRMGEVGPLVPKGFVSSVIELVPLASCASCVRENGPLVLIVRGLALCLKGISPWPKEVGLLILVPKEGCP